jgi:hypothetical protein
VSRAAFDIPWVVLSDAEPQTLSGLAGDLVDSGYVTSAALATAEAVARVPEDILSPSDCFSYAVGVDFEGALIASGAVPEFLGSIDKFLGPSAFSTFVEERKKKDPSFGLLAVPDQVAEMVRHGRPKRIKPLLAQAVAAAITRDGTDSSRIPAEIRLALERAASFSNGTAAKR